MALDSAQFEALVERLEVDARRDPVGYRRRVLLLALLAYGYIGLAVVLLAILTVAAWVSVVYLKAIGFKLALGLLIFLGLVLKAMWVRQEAPSGRELQPGEASPLFERVDSLRQQLGAPRFHHILLTDDFNAAVVQVPRLGLFGWHRNFLLIGLPLMKALTPEQFTAVLAHEFGHLAGGHAAVASWIYRLRMRWQGLVAALEQKQSWGTFLFLPFFRWYEPYFNAYSFPLARKQEFEADAASARMVSPAATAQALTAVSVVAGYLQQQYWPEVHRQADDQPRPALAPYAQLTGRLVVDLDHASSEKWLAWSMEQRTSVADSHPSLSDRLAALQQVPHLEFPQPGMGADSLLGEAQAKLTAEFDRRWLEAILPSWEQRHAEVQNGRARLAELDHIAAAGELELEIAFERATLTESFGAGAEAALAQYRQVYTRSPDSALYAFTLGARLLARDDADGVPLVTHAMDVSEDAIVPGCEALRDFHWRAGRTEEAHAWNERLTERRNMLHQAALERAEIHLADDFDTHGLTEEQLAGLQAQLQSIRGIRRVFFVRKRTQYLPTSPLYALAFTVTPWWRPHQAALAADVQQRILATVDLPGETIVFHAEATNRRFGRRFRKMPAARIL